MSDHPPHDPETPENTPPKPPRPGPLKAPPSYQPPSSKAKPTRGRAPRKKPPKPPGQAYFGPILNSEREEYIKAERSVRGIGGFYLVVAVFLFLFAALSYTSESGSLSDTESVVPFLVGVLYALGATGLLRFRTWGRFLGILLALPLIIMLFSKTPQGSAMGGTGTMIFWAVGATGTVLFLALMGRKVGRVCRPDYREIMAHTTPPKVRSHPLATCLMIIVLTPLVLFVLLLLIPMLAPLFYES